MNTTQKDQLIIKRFEQKKRLTQKIKTLWSKEKKKRFHLISINSIIGDHFDWDIQKIDSWCRQKGFDGMEIRIQDFVGFDNTRNSNMLKNFKTKDILTCHLSDWNAWVDLYNGNQKNLYSMFYSKNNIQKYFGTTNKVGLINRMIKEIKIAHSIKARNATWHANQINYDKILFQKNNTNNAQVIDAVISCMKVIRKKLPRSVMNIVSLENGSRMDTGVETLEDFKKIFFQKQLKNISITFDTAHRISFLLKNDIQSAHLESKMFEEFESNLGLVKKIRVIHLSDSLKHHNTIKISTVDKNKAKKDFWFKRRLIHENIIDDHMPIGFSLPSAKNILDLVSKIQRKKFYVVSELRAGNFETIEKALFLQKCGICY